MNIGIFGGSFDPVHAEHVGLVRAAKASLGLDKVVIVPSYLAPHKRGGASADGKDRLEMCKIAFGKLNFCEVSPLELEAGGTSYTYLTCRKFAEMYPSDTLYFLVGADMLEDFFTWREPEDILAHVTLAVCTRGQSAPTHLHEKFYARFGKDFEEFAFRGAEVSSTQVRLELAFGKEPASLDEGVLRYIRVRGLYAHPAIGSALALEKEERREHSFRVAKLAVARAKSLKIPESKALLASALHDCAKYVPLQSPLLAGFTLPEEVPELVVHQFSGAYLAEHEFGIRDEEILDAIRYHASGREDMTPLGKLIYLADLLEEGRTFEGVQALRALFWQDLDTCLLAAMEAQLCYLRAGGRPVYGLTERAYLWEKRAQNA